MFNKDINFYKNNPIPADLLPDKIFYSYRQKNISVNKLSDEKLVDIQKNGISGVNYYHETNNPPYYKKIPGSIKELYCRQTVLNKLLLINSYLKKFNLELFVFDAYRPIVVQKFFYNKWVPEYLKKKHPEKSESWIQKEKEKYWARSSNTPSETLISPPPHSTGAALDLTIRFIDSKQHLEMGTIFDDTSKKSHTIFFEKKDKKKMNFTEEEALKNRRLLFHVMNEKGFSSHPKEWWHFSYGDQMWSVVKGENAFYGYVKNIRKDSR